MSPIFDRIYRNGTVVNQDGRGEADIGVTAGKIAAIGDLSRASAGDVVDCSGLTVLPITKFAGFYVTGWFIGGGSTGTNGCPTNDPPPTPPYCPAKSSTPCAANSPRVQGAVWGYFVEQVFGVGKAKPGPDECVFTELGTCVAQLVR